MLISRITKNKSNALIEFDDNSTIEIRYELFLKNGLRKGDEIIEERVSSLKQQNQIFQAKETAFIILSRRLHSVKELKQKLSRKKFTQEIINPVIEDLINSRFLDDEKFAKDYSEERIRLYKAGSVKIKNELLAKGINKEIIDSVLSQDMTENEIATAIELAAKKKKSLEYKNLEPAKLKQKIFSFLLSKGYTYDVVKEVLSKMEN